MQTFRDELGMLMIALVAFTMSVLCAGHRATCPKGWFMSEPGICQFITPEKWHQSEHGGWIDDSEQGERYGVRLYCTNGTQLRQEGQSSWCQRP